MSSSRDHYMIAELPTSMLSSLGAVSRVETLTFIFFSESIPEVRKHYKEREFWH